MIKEYFTDGLIQIAIILSLLRVDLHTYMDTFAHQEVQELLQGPTSAFTQTRFHHQNWNRDIGAFIHPKHIDNHINELLQDVHALSRYRHLNTVNTRIEAYLVNNPSAHDLTSENASLSNETGTTTGNNTSANNGSTSTAASPNANNNSSNRRSEVPLKEEQTPIGAELTTEVYYQYKTCLNWHAGIFLFMVCMQIFYLYFHLNS